MMTKLRITIDRKNRVICGNCESVCSEVFELSPDDEKSQIVEQFRDGGDSSTGMVDETLEQCVRTAADECPMSIIEVMENWTKELFIITNLRSPHKLFKLRDKKVLSWPIPYHALKIISSTQFEL